MILKVKDLMKIMEDYAPTRLKLDFDNVGLMVGNTEDNVTSILAALDCTENVIDEAVSLGCNVILTHHPLLFIKPKTITNKTLQGRKIIKLIKNNISVYSAHTNLDAVKDGVNDFACELLGFKNFKIIEPAADEEFKNNSGIGRIINLEKKISLKELCIQIKSDYEAEVIRYSGDENKSIKKIAIINGSGQDYFNLCRKMGVDCIITGDTTYHYISDISEENIAVIDAGHFNSEWPAVKLIAKQIDKKINQMGYENKINISNQCKNPYKFL